MQNEQRERDAGVGASADETRRQVDRHVCAPASTAAPVRYSVALLAPNAAARCTTPGLPQAPTHLLLELQQRRPHFVRCVFAEGGDADVAQLAVAAAWRYLACAVKAARAGIRGAGRKP